MGMGFLDNIEHTWDLPVSEDSIFVRKNYYDTVNLLQSIRPMISPEVYNALIHGFANIFSEDNPRFNPDRFLEDLK